MRLVRSRFVHLVPVGAGRTLVVHALNDLRIVVDAEVAAILDFFAAPRTLPEEYPELQPRVSGSLESVVGAMQTLLERGLLTAEDAEAELAAAAESLGATYGRDPLELLEGRRRRLREGGVAYWASGPARGVEDLAPDLRRLDLVLLGDCDLQMESEFLREEGRRRGLDLRIAASFPDDVRLVAEHPHDAVLIGALRGRHSVARLPAGTPPPFAAFVAEAHDLLAALRARTAAPILIDNLPEPSVEPNGIAERGLDGHRNRFRLANVSLAQAVLDFEAVHVVDVAAVLADAGLRRHLDDWQSGFTHFGSPGWILQRPASERAAVHGQFPDLAPLEALLDGDAYGRERVMAGAHLDALVAALAIDQKKCVVLDLDGTLWPGVLAETGAPFAWSPEVSGGYSFIGHYFGLHEALLCLKRRGVLLACVSKNDEAVVDALWRYKDHYPRERLLRPEDFVARRINWEDKSANILAIAEELGFAPDAFLFIDDHPVERDRVRARLPAVEVWGEDLLGLRRRLLTDPRLQRPRITAEAQSRTELVRGQLARQRALAEATSEEAHLASLEVRTRFRALAAEDLERVSELLERTTQFNPTGRRFSTAELRRIALEGGGRAFAANVSDRFGDHGLVAACVVVGNRIEAFAMSCRVIGLGVETAFLAHVLDALGGEIAEVEALYVPTDRNRPARNLWRDAGFAEAGGGLWRRSLAPPEP